MKHPFIVCATGAMALTAALIACAVATAYYYPTETARFYASHLVGRSVTIGKATISLHPLTLELDDFRVANAPWAKQPDMLTIRHVAAEPEMASLLEFKPQFLHLSVEGATVQLERDENGVGNWKQDGSSARAPADEAARTRRKFPIILDLSVKDSSIALRTTGGNLLKVDFANLHLSAANESAPAALEVEGTYNTLPVRMRLATGSYEELRDTGKAFPVDIKAEGASLALDARLQIMDPFNFDQFTGILAAQVKNAGEAAGLMGGAFNWDKDLAFESEFTRDGDRWALASVKGKLAGNTFASEKIAFTEGGRKQPDDLKAKIDFANLEVTSLLPSSHVENKGTPFIVSENPPVLLDLILTAKEMVYKRLKALNLSFHARIAAGVQELEDASMDIFSTRLHAFLAVTREGNANAFSMKGELQQADVRQMLYAAGWESDMVSGGLNVALNAHAEGSNAGEWRKSLHGKVELSMRNAQVSRKLIHLASEDIRTLFNADHVPIAMPCMEAVLDFRQGIGTLSPFTIRTAEGTLLGAGTVNMPTQAFDLTFKTDAKTTSGLALDVPIHVGGTFDAPHVSLASSGDMPKTDAGNACAAAP